MHINLSDKVNEFKELLTEMAPKEQRMWNLRDKCRAKFEQPEPLTKEEYAEHHKLTHEVRELRFKLNDVALDIAAFICEAGNTVVEEDGKIIIER